MALTLSYPHLLRIVSPKLISVSEWNRTGNLLASALSLIMTAILMQVQEEMTRRMAGGDTKLTQEMERPAYYLPLATIASRP